MTAYIEVVCRAKWPPTNTYIDPFARWHRVLFEQVWMNREGDHQFFGFLRRWSHVWGELEMYIGSHNTAVRWHSRMMCLRITVNSYHLGLVITYSLQVHKMNTQWGCHVHMFHLPNQLTCQMMVSSCVFTPCSCWLFWSFWGMYCFCLQVKWIASSWCWSMWRQEMFLLHSTVWGSLVHTATEGKGSKLMWVDISKRHPILSGLHKGKTKIILYCLSSDCC